LLPVLRVFAIPAATGVAQRAIFVVLARTGVVAALRYRKELPVRDTWREAMQTSEMIAALRRHPFDKDFAAPHIERLASLASEAHFDRDQMIFREGEEFSKFYLIIAGRVALEMATPEGPLRVQTLSAGDELGWSAVLEGQGKYFEGGELMAACKADPAFGYAFIFRVLEVVSERLSATRLQVLDHFAPAAKRAGA
jgi:CRP/FNR family transcriptional regulator, cyclic AMP receptor protein